MVNPLTRSSPGHSYSLVRKIQGVRAIGISACTYCFKPRRGPIVFCVLRVYQLTPAPDATHAHNNVFRDSQPRGKFFGGSAIRMPVCVGPASRYVAPSRCPRSTALRRLRHACRALLLLCALTIVHSDFAGTGWLIEEQVVNKDLYAIACSSETEAYAVGQEGTVMKTSNNNEPSLTQWTKIETNIETSSGRPYNWKGATFCNTTHGWIAGTYGQIIHTRDSGDSWVAQDSTITGTVAGTNRPYTINGITVTPNRRGLWNKPLPPDGIVFAVASEGMILRTMDFGETWVQLYSRITEELYAVDFLTNDTGWVAGENGRILKTTDQGNTWIPIAVEGTNYAEFGLFEITFRAIRFPEETHGFVAGDDGYIIYSDGVTVGGGNFTLTRCHDSVIHSIAVDREYKLGWVVADDGVICISPDYGKTWRIEQSPQETALRGISQWAHEFPVTVGDGGLFQRYVGSPPPPPPPSSPPPLPPSSHPAPLPLLPSSSFASPPPPLPCPRLHLLLHPPPATALATSFRPHHPPPPPIAEWSLSFDGVDDYILTPVIRDILCISIWVKIAEESEITDSGREAYLIDLRYGNNEAYFGDGAIGQTWTNLYVDGVHVTCDLNFCPVGKSGCCWWASVPVGQWGHMHFELGEAVTDDVNFMSRVTGGSTDQAPGCLKGQIAEIYMWQVYLAWNEINIISGRQGSGFDNKAPAGYYAAYFNIEEGQAPAGTDIRLCLHLPTSFSPPPPPSPPPPSPHLLPLRLTPALPPPYSPPPPSASSSSLLTSSSESPTIAPGRISFSPPLPTPPLLSSVPPAAALPPPATQSTTPVHLHPVHPHLNRALLLLPTHRHLDQALLPSPPPPYVGTPVESDDSSSDDGWVLPVVIICVLVPVLSAGAFLWRRRTLRTLLKPSITHDEMQAFTTQDGGPAAPSPVPLRQDQQAPPPQSEMSVSSVGSASSPPPPLAKASLGNKVAPGESLPAPSSGSGKLPPLYK
ncbi:hypothetical protein CYMTET_8878 [Cymbomonas tetramitiformis]|uniref:Photosynthesis system II assembly factor Ycf48/Hcf136-like domain-containing protein n=1 Tax=Cymbomonas tetramitiformis TaxID=36881 RepID=A0AAE0GSM4_9CHLO|nr:hypothetical protein CYMTET_8878 [Cymbomonas tetramitiformis]